MCSGVNNTTRGTIMIKNTLFISALVLGVYSMTPTTSHARTNPEYAITLPEEAQNTLIGVNLLDASNNYPKAVNGLPNIVAHIRKSPEAFFRSDRIVKLHNYFLNSVPEVRDGLTVLDITGFVKYDKSSRFEKITVAYSGRGIELNSVSVFLRESIDLNDTDFNIKVGLVERKVIFQDKSNNIQFVIPVGVGSFDEGVMNEGKVSLLTPRFKVGYIDRNQVISKRSKPRYFADKPFIRLSKEQDGAEATPIGFHTEINSSFVRGFDSHGCMRLRDQDLYMLHDLIMEGTKRFTPITVSYQLEEKMDHPAAKRDKLYKTVQNNGTAESPFFPLDRDDLVQTIYKEKLAPMDKLVDTTDDHYEDVFDYDTVRQLREQNARRKAECDESVDSTDKKAYESCLHKGKRKSSASDKIYKWWVH